MLPFTPACDDNRLKDYSLLATLLIKSAPVPALRRGLQVHSNYCCAPQTAVDAVSKKRSRDSSLSHCGTLLVKVFLLHWNISVSLWAVCFSHSEKCVAAYMQHAEQTCSCSSRSFGAERPQLTFVFSAIRTVSLSPVPEDIWS